MNNIRFPSQFLDGFENASGEKYTFVIVVKIFAIFILPYLLSVEIVSLSMNRPASWLMRLKKPLLRVVCQLY